jgi:hypothetical protein
METYLTEQQLCDRLHISARTAQRWRSTGDGPAFVRVGARRVIYRVADVDGWASARTYPHLAAELFKGTQPNGGPPPPP